MASWQGRDRTRGWEAQAAARWWEAGKEIGWEVGDEEIGLGDVRRKRPEDDGSFRKRTHEKLEGSDRTRGWETHATGRWWETWEEIQCEVGKEEMRLSMGGASGGGMVRDWGRHRAGAE